MLNANGSSMSVISMAATPSPQPGYDDGKPELQIIHMDAPEGSQQVGPHPMASIMDRTPLKSITFHTEPPQRPRRTSTQPVMGEDHASSDRSASTAPRAPSRQHSQHSHSPVLPQRNASHSPALHRGGGEREPYSPHGSYHERSPYPPPAAPTPQQTQVPAPFASIMNAYDAPSRSPESPYESTPMNGGVSRLRGASTSGVER